MQKISNKVGNHNRLLRNNYKYRVFNLCKLVRDKFGLSINDAANALKIK